MSRYSNKRLRKRLKNIKFNGIDGHTLMLQQKAENIDRLRGIVFDIEKNNPKKNMKHKRQSHILNP